MRKRLYVLLAVFVLLCVVAIAVFFMRDKQENVPIVDLPTTNLDSAEPIPDDLKIRADAYIKEKVGEENFRKNYKFSQENSYVRSNGIKNASGAVIPVLYIYHIAYEYHPLTQLMGTPSLLRVTFFREVSKPFDEKMKPTDFVGCSDCEPTVSKSDALAIALKNGIEVNKEHVRIALKNPETSLYSGFGGYSGPGSPIRIKGWYWSINIPTKSEGGCSWEQTAYVDASTGILYDLGNQRSVCE